MELESEVMRLMARVFETEDTTAMDKRSYYAKNILDYVKEHPDPEEW